MILIGLLLGFICVIYLLNKYEIYFDLFKDYRGKTHFLLWYSDSRGLRHCKILYEEKD